MMKHPFAKVLASYLAGAVLALSFPAQGWAMFTPAASADLRGAELAKIRTTLESSVLQQRLTDYGLSPEEALAKINSLSDDQVHQLASRIDSLEAGGSIVGDVIVLLIIAVIVIVVLEATGHKIIVHR